MGDAGPTQVELDTNVIAADLYMSNLSACSSPIGGRLETPNINQLDKSKSCNYDALSLSFMSMVSFLGNTTPSVYDFSTPDMSNMSEFDESKGEVTPQVFDSQILSSSTTDDVTALPQNISTYPSLLRLVSSRTARLRSLRNFASSRSSSYVEDPPKGIDYDYLYDFGRYKKFTEGRPETQVFCQGRTFIYEKLPPFSQKSSKPKSKRKGRKAVTTPVNNQVSHDFVLNPLAPAFNYVNARDAGTALKELRVQNIENIIIGHLNINSLRYKFDALVILIRGFIDVLVIGKTKLDQSFPEKQFKI